MPSMSRRSIALMAAVSLIAAVVGAAHVVAQAPSGASLRWVKAAPFPEPEEELYGAVANGKLYVIGGFGYMPFGNPPGLVYEYDPGPDKWTKKKILPVRVHHQAQAVFNNKIYIFGGCKQGIFGTDAVNNVWEYDPATDAYKAMAPIPGPRCSAVAATRQRQDLSDWRHRAVRGRQRLRASPGRTRCSTRPPTRGAPTGARCRRRVTTRSLVWSTTRST